jgi:hypothetical protein
MLPPDGTMNAAVDIPGRNPIAVPTPCYNRQAAVGNRKAGFRAARAPAADWLRS